MAYSNYQDKTTEIFVSVALKEANLFYKDRMDATTEDVLKLSEIYLTTLLELNKKHGTPKAAPTPTYQNSGSGYSKGNGAYTPKPASDKQKNLINQLLSSKNIPSNEEEDIRNSFSSMTTKEAMNIIDKLKA